MSPSKVLFLLCLAFIAGIGVESGFDIPQIFLWIFLCLAVALVFLPYLNLGLNFKIIVVLGFCTLVFVLGVLRVQIEEFDIQNDKLSKLNGKDKIVLQGTIVAEPDSREKYQKLKIKTGESLVLINTKKYPEFDYLDQVKFEGKLETPMETEDFSYKNYLMKDRIYSVMNFPQIEKIGKETCSLNQCPGRFVYAKILEFKGRLRQSIRQNFSPPERNVLEGMILGDNGAMSQELKDKLNSTGLRHIIAVSGTHVVILSYILMSVLLFWGLWRSQAFYMSVIFIWLYIGLTGSPSSGIRAGVISTLFLLAQRLGRHAGGQRIMALAASAMLIFNPLLLLYDVGFQLSFLAVMGLIYAEPLIKKFLAKIIEIFKKSKTNSQKSPEIITVVSATLAAQIFTLPVLIYNFGNISFVAPITNMLVSPIVSLLMVFGFLCSFFGVFSSALGWVLSVPCYFLLWYFVWVVDVFSQPWASKAVENAHWIWVFVSYAFLAVIVRYLNKKYKPDFL